MCGLEPFSYSDAFRVRRLSHSARSPGWSNHYCFGHYVGVVWLGLTVAMMLYVTGDLWDKYQRAPHGRVKQFFRLLFFAISGATSWVMFEGPSDGMSTVILRRFYRSCKG